MNGQIVPFTVIKGGKRPRRKARTVAPAPAPTRDLAAKITLLKMRKPEVCLLVEEMVDRLLKSAGGA